jgi:hypothetical protein
MLRHIGNSSYRDHSNLTWLGLYASHRRLTKDGGLNGAVKMRVAADVI